MSVYVTRTCPLNTLLKAAEEGYLKPKSYQGRSVGLCTSGSPCVCPCRLHSFQNGCGTQRQYLAVVLVKNVFFSMHRHLNLLLLMMWRSWPTDSSIHLFFFLFSHDSKFVIKNILAWCIWSHTWAFFFFFLVTLSLCGLGLDSKTPFDLNRDVWVSDGTADP